MDTSADNQLPTKDISFPNGNRAVAVSATATDEPAAILEALDIGKPDSVVLLIGGADELDPNLSPQIETLFREGLLTVATENNALIVDGGTEAGVMKLIGRASTASRHRTKLLGVAPAGKVGYPGASESAAAAAEAALDPNHSHFVLVDGSEWSDATEVMFNLVTELAKESRVVAVLINGGDEAREEIARTARLGWPVIAVKGSGRLADNVAAEAMFTDQGDFAVFQLDQPPTAFRNLITQRAEGALIEAWKRFRQYDSAATTNRATHERLLSFTLIIGVLGTLFALAQKQFTPDSRSSVFVLASSIGLAVVPLFLMAAVTILKILRPREKTILAYEWAVAVVVSLTLLVLVWLNPTSFLKYAVLTFSYLAIGIPIIVSILLAGSNRFKNRHKWILARGAAEAIKKEIYRYRTRVGDYSDQPRAANAEEQPADKPQRSRDAALKDNIVDITQRLMQTELNTGTLKSEESGPPEDPKNHDDGFSVLSPERYILLRLEEQMNWYTDKTVGLQKQGTEFQWLIYIIGGAGSLLAALGAQLWVALTTAAVTALTAWVTDLKLDVTLVKYNQAAADLSNLRYWWSTLSAQDKARLENRQNLVNTTESILEIERGIWIQQMEEVTKEVKQQTKEKPKPQNT